jgi:hypothetical protein
MRRRMSTPDYKQMVERWIGQGATAAKATKIEYKDDQKDGRFALDVEFAAPLYAQIMQDRLMVFKPAIISRLERLSFSEGKRMHPFLIDATSYSESVKIKLPSGFVVDELPEATKLEMHFGQYDASFEVKDDTLIFNRTLKLNRASVPAEKYETVKSFFGRIHAAEQSPVVLLRK